MIGYFNNKQIWKLFSCWLLSYRKYRYAILDNLQKKGLNSEAF